MHAEKASRDARGADNVPVIPAETRSVEAMSPSERYFFFWECAVVGWQTPSPRRSQADLCPCSYVSATPMATFVCSGCGCENQVDARFPLVCEICGNDSPRASDGIAISPGTSDEPSGAHTHQKHAQLVGTRMLASRLVACRPRPLCCSLWLCCRMT